MCYHSAMALLKIYTYPHPILNKVAGPVEDFGPAQQQFFDDMVETMYVEDGVGLAAPQVGVSKRILVACPTMRKGEEYVVVNPEIYYQEGRVIDIEGCLSVPGITGEVPRARIIKVRYQDREGKYHDRELRDFFARVLQHEIDHLDGKLLIDRVDFNKRQELLARYQYL